MHYSFSLFVVYVSPDVREFFSLDNPKNAQANDDDDQDAPGTDEADSQASSITPHAKNNHALESKILQCD